MAETNDSRQEPRHPDAAPIPDTTAPPFGKRPSTFVIVIAAVIALVIIGLAALFFGTDILDPKTTPDADTAAPAATDEAPPPSAQPDAPTPDDQSRNAPAETAPGAPPPPAAEPRPATPGAGLRPHDPTGRSRA